MAGRANKHFTKELAAKALARNNAVVTIPAGYSVIEDEAFSHCDTIRELRIGPDVRAIGNYAFQACENLEIVEIGGILKYIGDHAFHACKALKAIDFLGEVEHVGNFAFCQCNSIKERGNTFIFRKGRCWDIPF